MGLSKTTTVLLSIIHLTLAKETFWQITDVHWDREYSLTGDPKNLCHGEGFVNDTGFYGNSQCDSNTDLMDLTIKAMAAFEQNPDFILWTGDNAPHIEFPNQTWADVYSICYVMGSHLQASFPSSTILPILGNHDTVPSDQFPANDENFYNNYLTIGNWSRFISQEQWSTFLKGGYYSTKIKEGLKVLVLNTGLYLTNNNLILETDSDPSNQFSWFLDEMNTSRNINEKVIIVSHVAPGYFATGATELNLKPKFNDKLIQLIVSYSDVIVTLIFGHEHMDTFRLFADFSGNIKTHAFLAGPVDVWIPEFLRETQATNAGIRLYEYNSIAGLITDYQQFYVDFMQANSNISEGTICTDGTTHHSGTSVCICNETPSQNECATVELLYRPTQAYNVIDLSTVSMIQIYKNIKANPEIFETFFNYSTLNYVIGSCNSTCQNNYLCSIVNITEREMKQCMNLSTVYSSSSEFDSIVSILFSFLSNIFS